MKSSGHATRWQSLFTHLTQVNESIAEQARSSPFVQHNSTCFGDSNQAIASAISLAIAGRSLAAIYNKPGFNWVNYMTWCLVDDVRLDQGTGLVALSLAGNWKLNNLCIIYDSSSTPYNQQNATDLNAKLKAMGWDVIHVLDGINVAGMSS